MAVNDRNLTWLMQFVRREIGLVLDVSKLYLVRSRLQPLVRMHELAGIDELIAAVRREERGELARQMLDQMTTNETLFFRDSYPYLVLRKHIFPDLQRSKGFSGVIRIWSAAASTGQEALSIAMTAKAALPGAEKRVHILGTDISKAAIDYASAGIYKQMEVQRGLPIGDLMTHFTQHDAHSWQAKPHLKAMTRFKQANLISHALPNQIRADGPFDVVFCRNVLIYFDLEQRKQVIDHISRLMPQGGWLFTGAGEQVDGNRSEWLSEQYEGRPVWRLQRSA